MTNSQHKQQGLALMMLVFVLVLVAASFTIKTLNTNVAIEAERDLLTIRALKEAKTALLGFALTYDDTHPGQRFGYLPCPDTDTNDATPTSSGAGSQSVCKATGVSVIGRLPWKTLKVSPIKDGGGECLWYAVSGSFKNSPAEAGLNPTTAGAFKVLDTDGKVLSNSDVNPVVAIVFSPGGPLGKQNRAASGEDPDCGGNYSVVNYLDSAANISNNNVSDLTFVVDDSDQFNDQLMLITQQEVFQYYCKKYYRTLANKVNLKTGENSCIDADGNLTADCASLEANIQYCTSVSCKAAATDILTTKVCADAACQQSVNELKGCDA